MHGRRRALAAISLAMLVPSPPLRAQALPDRFDPARDAARDLDAALAKARAERKRVIVDVGGEWCSWCHILDRFFAANPGLLAWREAHYVWLKVNFSRANENRALLSRWPAVAGYPHLFVLDAGGALVHSQDTSELEEGKGYGLAKVRAFLERHAAPLGAKA